MVLTPPRIDELQPGYLVDNRYEVLSILGKGAMGEVYLARDRRIGRQVALKMIRAEKAAHDEIRRRVEHELYLMGRLGTHPNIVPLFDGVDIGSSIVLVMEYVPGETLDNLIKRTREADGVAEGDRGTLIAGPARGVLVLTPVDACRIARQCLEGLRHVHSLSLVHRDIKPSNIMVLRDHRGELTARLMDFGIAKDLTQHDNEEAVAEAATKLTQAGMMMPGTPSYMAPEQISPEHARAEFGPSADIYSLGCTLYEMLTLQCPFKGQLMAVLHSHMNTPPAEPRSINPLICPKLNAAVMKALAKHPSQRHGSAQEFLLRLAEAEAEQDRFESMPQSVGAGFARKEGKGVWIMVALGLLLIGGALVAVTLPNSGEEKPSGQDPVVSGMIPPATQIASPMMVAPTPLPTANPLVFVTLTPFPTASEPPTPTEFVPPPPTDTPNPRPTDPPTPAPPPVLTATRQATARATKKPTPEPTKRKTPRPEPEPPRVNPRPFNPLPGPPSGRRTPRPGVFE